MMSVRRIASGGWRGTTMAGDRDEKGRFVKGVYKGGPGRPPRVNEAEYLDNFRRRVPPEKLAAVADKLLELALDGDVSAIRLLFAYALGQPIQRVDATVDQRSLSVELQAALDVVYGDVSEGS